MKRILSVILCFIMLLSLFSLVPFLASAKEIDDDLVVLSSDGLFGYYPVDDGEIAIYAYYGDETVVDIPTSIDGYTVVEILEDAFHYCDNLQTVNVPKTVYMIEADSFYGCYNLNAVNVSAENEYYSSQNGILYSKDKTELKYYPLGKTDTSVTILDGVVTICEKAFSKCENIKKVTFPSSVKYIEYDAFYYCINLEKVILSSNLLSIGDYAFESCESLKEISIPASVTSIKNSAFFYCYALEAINVVSDNKNYSSENGVLFNKNKTELLLYPTNRFSFSYTIPSTVTIISERAFYNCDNIENVTIPNSVTTIEDYAFEDCDCLTEIKIPGSVKTIGEYAFSTCSNLEKVVLEDGIETIENYAFSYCYSLKDITIPKSVKTIGDGVFEFCENLSAISVASGNKHYVAVDGILYDIAKTKILRYPPLKTDTSFTVPATVTEVTTGSFSDCKNLTKVTLPTNLQYIGSEVFDGCTYLNSIVIPDKVEEIGSYAFSYCQNLESLTIGKSVKIIGTDAFYYCEKLKKVTIPDSVEYLYAYAFEYCTNLSEVKFGKNIKEIEYDAFIGCKNLKSVTLPAGIEYIGSYALGYTGNWSENEGKVEGFTIIGRKGSDAERYANENDFIFKESGERIKGDADMDGSVTVVDATIIQKWLAHLVTDSQIDLSVSDTDNDGAVTVVDATRIQKFLAGLIEEL